MLKFEYTKILLV